jgi:magnesium transporter
VQEDILNNRQRPKLEDYGDYLFIATRVFDFPPMVVAWPTTRCIW